MTTMDIVFLSYDEPQAEENFQNLKKRYPRAKRLHGVHGLGRAYKMTAEIVDTPYYYLVDADNEILADFSLDEQEIPQVPNLIKIWMSENAVNGLVYGYGGLKLCFQESVRTFQDNQLDVLASGTGTLIFEERVASITRFNSSPFSAWKAGFRECCMLTAGNGLDMPTNEASQKISIWKSTGADKPFGSWAIHGAHDGVAYANSCSGNFALLKQIDDPKWLLQNFNSLYQRLPNQNHSMHI